MFWKHPWVDIITLECKSSRLGRIALNPNGSVLDHWDTSTNSWSIYFRRLLNDEEILDFQALLSQISSSQPASFPDQRFWSLENSGSFLVKSLVKHLSTSSPLESSLYKRLWKSNSPRRINISIWIMLCGNLNCASVLQRKLSSYALSPHACPLCVNNMENIQHLLLDCVFASKCWFCLLQAFNFCWVFYHVFKNNLLQILAGPDLKKKTAELLWANAVKALLTEIWFERNQRVFHDKSSTWLERYNSAVLNASSWCSLTKYFQDYSS